MVMLVENLESLEKVTYQLKRMLKEPEYSKFEELKKDTLAGLKQE